MSELLEKHYSPESIQNLVPIEPYYDSLLQFYVLQSMGYPVRVHELEAKDIGDDVWPHDEFFQWEKQTYDRWAQLQVTVPAFANWIETPDTPGDLVLASGRQQEIDNHPIRLLYKVSIADHGFFNYYLDELKGNGELPHMDTREGLITEELLERCFMAAFERADQRWLNGYPGISDFDIPGQDDIDLYNELIAQGQEAVKSEELMAIVWDYYLLVEETNPVILVYKMANQ